MIVEALVKWAGKILLFLFEPLVMLVPGPTQWVYDGFNGLATVVDWVYELDHWVPVTLAFTVAGAVFATYVVTTLLELGRMIASFLTLGGGAK